MEVRDKVIKQNPIWERPFDNMQRTRKGAALSYSSMPSTEERPVAAVSVDQSKFTVIQLNHNNAVAMATTTAAVSPFDLILGQFSLYTSFNILLPQTDPG